MNGSHRGLNGCRNNDTDEQDPRFGGRSAVVRIKRSKLKRL